MVNSPLDFSRPDFELRHRVRSAARGPWRRCAIVALAATTLLLPGALVPDPVAAGEVTGSSNVGYGKATVGGRGGTIVRVIPGM